MEGALKQAWKKLPVEMAASPPLRLPKTCATAPLSARTACHYWSPSFLVLKFAVSSFIYKGYL